MSAAGKDRSRAPVDGEGVDGEGVDGDRRRILALAALGGLTLAPGVSLFAVAQARPAGEPASSKVRWGMLIDAGRCADGCDACVTACQTENGWQDRGRPATDAQWIRKLTVTDRRSGVSQSLPMMCQHCRYPPCVDVCPTGASFKRADGIVLVDKHTCIGCRYCMMACPYKARSFVHEDVDGQKPYAPRGKGTVESCTMCVHRVDEGRDPACVEACARLGGGAAGGALAFGDLNDSDSAISRLVARYRTRQVRADLGLDPGIRYQGL